MTKAAASSFQQAQPKAQTTDEANGEAFKKLLHDQTSAESKKESKNSASDTLIEGNKEDSGKEEEFVQNLFGAFWRMPPTSVEKPLEGNPTFKLSVEESNIAVSKAVPQHVPAAAKKNEGILKQVLTNNVTDSPAATESSTTVRADLLVEETAMLQVPTKEAAAVNEKETVTQDGKALNEKQTASVREAETKDVPKTTQVSEKEIQSSLNTKEVMGKAAKETAPSESNKTYSKPVSKASSAKEHTPSFDNRKILEKSSTETKENIPKESLDRTSFIEVTEQTNTFQAQFRQTEGSTPKAQPSQTELKTVPKEQVTTVLKDMVVEQSQSAESPGLVTTRIKLTPNHLGEVDVQLEMNNNRLTAKIVVEHPETKQWLEQQLTPLTKVLADQAIHIQDFQVAISQSAQLSSQFNGQFQEGKQPGFDQKKSNRRFTEGNNETEETQEKQSVGRLSLLA